MTKKSDNGSRLNLIIERVMKAIGSIFDQLLMILDLQTLDNSVETRMKRLRHIFYEDEGVHMGYRRVKDVMRGHVEPQYYDEYQRLLSAERMAHQMSQNLPSGARAEDLLEQMQRLGDQVAKLLDQLQQADKLASFYDQTSEEAKLVQQSQVWLRQRVDDALAVHGGIPARMMSFQTASAGRGADRFSERIERLTNRLDDIADAYAELDQYKNYEHLQNLMQADDDLP